MLHTPLLVGCIPTTHEASQSRSRQHQFVLVVYHQNVTLKHPLICFYLLFYGFQAFQVYLRIMLTTQKVRTPTFHYSENLVPCTQQAQ